MKKKGTGRGWWFSLFLVAVAGILIGYLIGKEWGAEKKIVVEQLVKKYEAIFGKTSLEVCKEVFHSLIPIIPKEQVPSIFA